MGAGGQGAARINPALQVVSEVNGCLVVNMKKTIAETRRLDNVRCRSPLDTPSGVSLFTLR